MTRHQRKKNNRPTPPPFYRWHRRIGASAALFLIWIVISGWLLNHSDSLNLAHSEIHSPALAHWYKLNYQTPTQGFTHNKHWLMNSDDILLLDGKKINTPFSHALGLAAQDKFTAIANMHEILLLDEQQSLIDKLSDSSLPIKNISQIGSGCNGIVISDNQQNFSTSDGLAWQVCNENIIWSQTEILNAQQIAQLKPQIVPAVSVEKLLIDLHTGRFFGRYGAYVVDTVGLCLLLLALSGLWLFFKVGNRPTRH
jgi:hypothetical protein